MALDMWPCLSGATSRRWRGRPWRDNAPSGRPHGWSGVDLSTVQPIHAIRSRRKNSSVRLSGVHRRHDGTNLVSRLGSQEPL